jgi:Homeodomain-like domain
MNVRYQVELSQDQRAELKARLAGGNQAARKLKRAQILLAADAGAQDEVIATTVGVGGSTVYRTKRRFVLGNLGARPDKSGGSRLREDRPVMPAVRAC